MATLPQLNEDDIRKLDETLRDFLAQTDAAVAMVTDQAGFLIAHQGEHGELDLTTLCALASGSFLASQTIAKLVQERDFNHTVLQGVRASVFTANVDQQCLLVVVFPSQTGVGIVKYYSAGALGRLAAQLAVARARDPEGGLDLSELNVANPEEFFRRKG
jgi:predicted regulator of Ras-like GTPase activity (Roadblock/LC7/MglB family)